MSDAVALAFISALVTVALAILTPWTGRATFGRPTVSDDLRKT